MAGYRLKVYGIWLQGRDAPEQLVERTLALAEESLPQPAVTGDRYGAGFVIAHDARTAGIPLIYWWQSENELHQRVFAGPRERLDEIAQLENQTAGCVWELEIIDFERRAWLMDVLANPAGPDLERYLSDTLEARTSD